MNRAQSFTDVMDPHKLATEIAFKYQEWEDARRKWLMVGAEARDYVFATDTRSTTSGDLGWKNSTHLPKLCQIRDNLHANYMAAVFPNSNAITWEGEDEEAEKVSKKKAIRAYMKNKLDQSDFDLEVEKWLYDLIDYGNVFGIVDYLNEFIVQEATGELIKGYIGPKSRRISPLDIVFNPTASDFRKTPKIIRTLTSLSDLMSEVESSPEKGYLREVVDEAFKKRAYIRSGAAGIRDTRKNRSYIVDGFGSYREYFDSDYVELLEFYGDIWDQESETLLTNYHITVIDRAYVVRKTQHPSWLGEPPIYHAGWRVRPDNLYAMGPLDNLIGMQYRIDHLENAKADAMDMILHPVMKIKGFVEEFVYGPNEKIYVGDDGDVTFMNPDATALSANTEIFQIMQLMEEMAGAPREAMGFRSPGEKTKYEVQVLENASNRVFLNKTAHFEKAFLEKVLNAMLESARRNVSDAELVRIEDPDLNFIDFLRVSKEDIVAKGKIRAMGARRFARKANVLQELSQFAATPLGQDPTVKVHFSGYKMAKLIEELLELGEYNLVGKDVSVAEQAETAQLANNIQQVLMEEEAAGLDATGQAGMAQGQPQPR